MGGWRTSWLGIYADITEARAFAERERLQTEKTANHRPAG